MPPLNSNFLAKPDKHRDLYSWYSESRICHICKEPCRPIMRYDDSQYDDKGWCIDCLLKKPNCLVFVSQALIDILQSLGCKRDYAALKNATSKLGE